MGVQKGLFHTTESTLLLFTVLTDQDSVECVWMRLLVMDGIFVAMNSYRGILLCAVRFVPELGVTNQVDGVNAFFNEGAGGANKYHLLRTDCFLMMVVPVPVVRHSGTSGRIISE